MGWVGRAAVRRGWAPWRVLVPCIGVVFGLVACGDGMSEIRDLQQQGRFAESLKPLQEALVEHPADSELNFLYGRALLLTGRAGGAVWPLSRARENAELAVPAGLLLTTALLQGGSATDAIVAAGKVLEIEPDNLQARVLHARAQVDAVHNKEALQELDALIEENPDDTRLRALRIIPLIRLERLDEAGEQLAELRVIVSSGELRDPAVEAHFCAAEATFREERDQREEAQKAWEGCLEKYRGNPTILRGALEFYGQTGQSDLARSLLERSLEEAPDNIEIRIALADQLRAEGEAEKGRHLMEEGVSQFPSAEAWSALADYHVAGGDYRAARDAIEHAIEMLPTMSEELRFAYADVSILAGDLDSAEQIVDSLELPVQRDLLRGRIELARGDAQSAFESFEKGIGLWPNNATARYLAGQAAEQLGNFGEAVSQYREAVRVDPAAGEAALALVSLQRALGTPNLAIEPLRVHLAENPRDVAAWRSWVRLLFDTQELTGARQGLQRLRSLDPRAAVVVGASLRREREGPQVALAALEASKLDLTRPQNVEVLNALVVAAIDAGSPGRALRDVDAAVAAHPDAPEFHELRGRVLRAQGDASQAQAAFERALELDPDRAASLLELGRMAEANGKGSEALALYDRASAADRSSPDGSFAAGELLASRGDRDQAIARFESALRVSPLDLEAARRLADLLASEGRDLARALDVARRAVAVGRSADDLERLGQIQIARGEGSAAAASLGQALEKEPESASAQYWLGRALALSGDRDAAREAYRKALASADADEAERARAELAKLERRDAS